MKSYYLFANQLGIISNGQAVKVPLTVGLLEALCDGDLVVLDRVNPLTWTLLETIDDDWFQGAIACRQGEKVDIFVN